MTFVRMTLNVTTDEMYGGYKKNLAINSLSSEDMLVILSV